MPKIKNQIRLENAQKSLLGVSIGDAFGDSFFGDEDKILEQIDTRQIPKSSWEFTDDTVMSIAIFEELEKSGEIDQDRLIRKFCINHDLDPKRGYGATLRKSLRDIQAGANWREVSGNVFDGQGSMGNGAAMRVCPIGAYYFDDLKKAKESAIRSAEITHANHEAIAGAIAIAIGTAFTTRMKIENSFLTSDEFIDKVVNEVPDSDTRAKIVKSKSISYNYHIETVTNILGNGKNMLAQDTVPFVIWCASHNLNNFEDGLWKAVSALGDRDTICAMVGGMLIMSAYENTIPDNWINAVEKIENSPFRHR
ncbi:MAG: ADP-ribosylglycohydrolase family protein [Bacteroidia bacterium]|jgi:ADP-ribosylglycohydrolase|nr:ADP-ribosylglycohydrolase family protein [Bacteroidia bacterium]